jgi:Uma2 family endonuclease
MSAHRTGSDEPLYTIEEFEHLPEEDLYRVELVRGLLLREPRPAALHGWVLANLTALLHTHVKRYRLGYVFTDVGIIISHDPATVRGPDLAFVSTSRLPHGPPERGFLGFVPDLCVEIISPSNRADEIQEKVLDYLNGGASLVWVVNPELRTLAEHRSGRRDRVLGVDGEVEGYDVVPGLHLPLVELFTT